jgi:methionyl-tRNA formyltransferase
MGTPAFVVPLLAALVEMPGITLAGVVTRRDQAAGRGRGIEAPPVKVAALARDLPVLQPGSLRKPEAQAALAALEPEIIIVAAFGQILPQTVLDLPPYGCLNVHFSLLPTYRGASPISAAILAGDTETGTTIMRMDAGLDTGDIIAQATLPIAPDDTTQTLTAKLATLSADLLRRVVPEWLAGALTPVPQDPARASTTTLIRKEDGLIEWGMPAATIARRVRAFTPWPGTWSLWRGQPMKILAAHEAVPEDGAPDPAEHAPGTVLAWGRGAGMRLGVVCGARTLLVPDMLQLPGKRAATAPDVARGQPALIGATLPS